MAPKRKPTDSADDGSEENVASLDQNIDGYGRQHMLTVICDSGIHEGL